MGYFANLKMEDQESEDVYKVKGKAEKVLAKGINYLHKKGDHKNFLKRLAEYVSEDFAELNESLRMAGEKIIGKK